MLESDKYCGRKIQQQGVEWGIGLLARKADGKGPSEMAWLKQT